MLKRLLALMLCLVMLLCAVPVSADTVADGEEQRIRKQITNTYWKTLYASGVGSLRGYCGLMAGLELYYLGVTEVPITYNGNEMYDILSVCEYINEGYSRDLYPVSSYTLEEALNAVCCGGTRDVYNLMVGYQWTNTAAGQRYGHVTVIHAILDGTVYFTEGFSTPFNSNPSQAMVCSIPEFCNYYNAWTRFEGLIHFGSGNSGEDNHYSSRLYFAANEEKKLLAEPDLQCENVGRSVPAGERLFADDLFENEAGDIFYRVVDDGKFYYVSADNTSVVCLDHTDLSATDIQLPQQMRKGKDFSLSGVIRSQNNQICGLVVQIRNESGEIVLTQKLEKNGYMVDLSTKLVNNRVDISSLPEGSYTYEICCDLVNHYVRDGQVIGEINSEMIASSQFTVGEVVSGEQTDSEEDEAVNDGWQLMDGSWYYYQNGSPRVGWFCDDGIDYYFLEDGAAATGWHTINGKARYFSETGAMRTGWMETEEGRFYLLSNGAAATGLKTIQGSIRYFGENGLLATDTTVTYQNTAYQVDANGIASPVNA